MKTPDYTLIGDLIKPKVRGTLTKRWYQCYRLDDDPKRTIHKCPLFTDKAKSRNRIKEEIAKHIAKRQPKPELPEHAAKTLEQHLTDYLPIHRRDTSSEIYATNSEGHIRRVVADLGWQQIEDIKAQPLHNWLAQKKCADATRKRYWASVSAFCSWLVAEERLPSHPLLGKARKRKGESRTTFSRRALDSEELVSLITTTAASSKVIKDLPGPDRAMLYLFCSCTGLRAHEASSISPASFDWEEPATVVIDSWISKRRRTDVVQLPTALVAQLRPWVEGKDADAPLWPGPWWQRAADVLYKDLKAAGIEYDDKAAKLDFHALRTTHITNVVGTAAALPMVMKICRLSSPSLLKNYYRPRSDEQTAAVEAVKVPTIK